MPSRAFNLAAPVGLLRAPPSRLIRYLLAPGILFYMLLFSVCGFASGDEAATLVSHVRHAGADPSLIYLETLGKKRAVVAENRTVYSLISRQGQFEPAFQVIPMGSILNISNQDSYLHNTHVSESGQTLFNVATPSIAQTVQKALPRSGIYDVYCDLHPWMKAKIAVVTSPYFSVVQETGNFEIRNIPPGNYKLHIWQSGQEEIVKPVTLAAKEKKTISPF